MRRLGVSIVLGGLLTLASAGLALGNHQHDLINPARTVEDIARGNTGRCPGEPAGHRFHSTVHLPVFGPDGVAQSDKVTIVKVGDSTCS